MEELNKKITGEDIGEIRTKAFESAIKGIKKGKMDY